MVVSKTDAWKLFLLLDEVVNTKREYDGKVRHLYASDIVLGSSLDHLTILLDGKMIGYIDLYQDRVVFYPEPVRVSIPLY